MTGNLQMSAIIGLCIISTLNSPSKIHWGWEVCMYQFSL